MSSGDKPMSMDEAIAHYAGRLSDPMKVKLLRSVVSDLLTRGDLGFHDYGAGRGCAICDAVERARQALLDTEDK